MRADDEVTVIPCAGSEEERKESDTFLRLSGYRKTGHIALSNKQMASRESKAH